jgi:hypothetical protein
MTWQEKMKARREDLKFFESRPIGSKAYDDGDVIDSIIKASNDMDFSTLQVRDPITHQLYRDLIETSMRERLRERERKAFEFCARTWLETSQCIMVVYKGKEFFQWKGATWALPVMANVPTD